MKKAFVSLALAAACVAGGSARAALPSGPVSANLEVAPPGAQAAGFVFTDIFATKSAPLVFVQADPIGTHDFTVLDAAGHVVVKSATGGVGQEQVDLSKLAVGRAYRFVCTVHESVMKGTLTIEA